MKKRENNYQLIGDKIYEFRKEKGLSQEEFANRIGVSRQIVSKWESNQSVPLVDKLKRISEEFDISYEEIMMGTEYQKDTKKKGILRYIIIFLILILVEVMIVLIYSYVGNHNDYKEYHCLGTQTYYVDKIYNGEDDNYQYVILMNEDKIPETVKMKKLITNYLEIGNSYEFIFRSNDENDSIKYIFENDEIINVIRLDINNRKSVNKIDCRKVR